MKLDEDRSSARDGSAAAVLAGALMELILFYLVVAPHTDVRTLILVLNR